MSKKFLLILLTGFFIATPKLISANIAEEKPSLALFSQMKQLRSRFPNKSTFETNEEYQEKINSINFAPPPIKLDFIPESGEYDPQNRQLKISLPTDYEDLDELPEADKNLAQEALYASSYKDILKYRTDEIFREEEIVTCVNGFGAKSQYKHNTVHTTQYLINVIEEIDRISIEMTPHQAKSYFDKEEKFINNRLIIQLSLRSISPFYSYFTSYHSDPCDNNKSPFAELVGTWTIFNNNHLIHAHIHNLEVIDSITGKTIFYASYTDK
ncbi:MAG: hypothetical protein ACFCU5_20045 [Pleurocapsa sp.]